MLRCLAWPYSTQERIRSFNAGNIWLPLTLIQCCSVMLQLLHNLSNDGWQQSSENNCYSCIYRHFFYPPGGLRVTPIWKSFISSFNIWHIIERNSLVLGRAFIYCGKMCLDMPRVRRRLFKFHVRNSGTCQILNVLDGPRRNTENVLTTIVQTRRWN